jgi:hypothetical protein
MGLQVFVSAGLTNSREGRKFNGGGASSYLGLPSLLFGTDDVYFSFDQGRVVLPREVTEAMELHVRVVDMQRGKGIPQSAPYLSLMLPVLHLSH